MRRCSAVYQAGFHNPANATTAAATDVVAILFRAMPAAAVGELTELPCRQTKARLPSFALTFYRALCYRFGLFERKSLYLSAVSVDRNLYIYNKTLIKFKSFCFVKYVSKQNWFIK